MDYVICHIIDQKRWKTSKFCESKNKQKYFVSNFSSLRILNRKIIFYKSFAIDAALQRMALQSKTFYRKNWLLHQ